MTPRRAKYLRNRTRGRSIPFGWDIYYLHSRQEWRLIYVMAQAGRCRVWGWHV